MAIKRATGVQLGDYDGPQHNQAPSWLSPAVLSDLTSQQTEWEVKKGGSLGNRIGGRYYKQAGRGKATARLRERDKRRSASAVMLFSLNFWIFYHLFYIFLFPSLSHRIDCRGG